jgi:hypothetical protein
MQNHPVRFSFLPRLLALLLVLAAALPVLADVPTAVVGRPSVDWMVNPAPYQATVTEDSARHELILDNGLARRVIRLAPNAATTDLVNRTSGEHLLRAVSPEARVTLNGTDYPVGGLDGQNVQNYLKADWLKDLHKSPGSYQFAGWQELPMSERLKWKKRPEWLARDLPWPAPGKHVVMRYTPPAAAIAPRGDLPEIEIHYELYHGIPLFSKWLVVNNRSAKTVRVDSFVADELRLAEVESSVNSAPVTERPNLWVETDFAFNDMSAYYAQPGVELKPDPDYATQVHYSLQTPCLLRCKPPVGPAQDVAAGATFESFRVFELLLDSADRERRTLAQRKMYRLIAPWTQENPLMFHKVQSDPATVRAAIDQAAEVGFEMVILSFGSGFNFESRDPTYWDTFKELADYGKAKGVALGGYSLLASRGAANAKDNTQGSPPMYGLMPCLGTQWGRDYLQNIVDFSKYAGLGVFENDGSYPGDLCAATDHPFHQGRDDSQWVMWRAITEQYKTLRGEGVFLNVPDWYFLTGSNKCGMGYRETNWSLPRAEQEIIERQNMYDGTWNKTQTMGWMFVPLSQYHGGGAAATIEPLHQHLPHYEARFANLLGFGVQACYRGPRLFDTEETKALVEKWVKFYKDHRQVLDQGDIIHLRRANGLDWDGILHANPQGLEKGLAFFYNPLTEDLTRDIRIPLHYTGLTAQAQVTVDGGTPQPVTLDPSHTVTLTLTIPAQSRTWVLFTE